MKKKDICRLKGCLRDFKTKDHLCLFPDLLSFELSFQNDLSCPPMLAWALSLCFCFLHLILSIIVLGFFLLKIFGSFGFSLTCPSFAWAALMIENFLLCPQYCLGTFNRWGSFLCFSHLPPSVGCDPSQGYFWKMLLGSKRDCKMINFSLVNGLLKKWPFLISNTCTLDR